MRINDFSALIQLAATMSIAFFAVEYVKSYTSILCEKLFRFQDFVKKAFDDCRALLTDSETLDHLDVVDIGEGKTTVSEVEGVKRKIETLNVKINDAESQKKEHLAKACEAKSMSSMCLFISLCCIILLALGALECTFQSEIQQFSWIFNILCSLYILLGWFIGENNYRYSILDFSSLRHPVCGFGVILAVSLLIFFFVNLDSWEWLSCTWWYVFLFVVCLFYANFVVFVMKIRNKAIKYKSDVEKSKVQLKNECSEAAKAANDLINTTELINRLKSDN